MPNYYQNDQVFDLPGYEFYFTRFADSIIDDHFKEAREEIRHILEEFKIEETLITQSGGGLSKITQKLGGLLVAKGWRKEIIESAHHVGGKILTSESHEVDHYKRFEQGNLGLEIEWNNKDPFFDRDLENFRKLHQIGEMSLGVIITRGASLQEELLWVIRRFLEMIYPFDLPILLSKISLSDEAKKKITLFLNKEKKECLDKIASVIYYSKYGSATTHMNKLLLRLDRGVGNPCPFILIGIGKERLMI